MIGLLIAVAISNVAMAVVVVYCFRIIRRQYISRRDKRLAELALAIGKWVLKTEFSHDDMRILKAYHNELIEIVEGET